jgi:hypothetical protein
MKKITYLISLFSITFTFSQNDTLKVNQSDKQIVVKDTIKKVVEKESVQESVAKPTQVTNFYKPSNKGEVKVLVTANIGASFRLAETSKNATTTQKNFEKNLLKGYSFDLGFYIRLNNSSALGFKFNRFISNKPTYSGQISFDQNVEYNKLTASQFINFYGVSYLFDNKVSDSPHELHAEISMGAMSFFQESDYSKSSNPNLLNLYIKSEGTTFGLMSGLGYKYRAFDQFSFGPQLNYAIGVISKIDFEANGQKGETKLEGDNKISLTRIDLSLGAVYRF